MDLSTLVVALAAAWVGFSAYGLLSRQPFIVDNLVAYGVPERWWPVLGVLKAAGAVGLAVGLVVPWVGVAAAIGLVGYFSGAVVTVLRARSYAHVAFPLLYLVPAGVAGWLLAVASTP